MKKLIIATAIVGVIIISFMVMPLVLKNNSSELGILLKNRNYRAVYYLIFNIKEPVKAKKPTKVSAHVMPEKDQKDLLSDVKNNIQIYEKITNDTTELKNIMDGKALAQVTKNIDKLLGGGIIRVRNFQDEKFTVKGYVNGLAQVTFEFTDRSYDYYAKTKKIASQPRNVKVKLALAVQKKDDVWKITEILQPQVKKSTNGKI